MATIRSRVILNVTNEKGRRVRRREFWSRSFLLHFIELLYNQHAQLATAIRDIGSTSRTLTLGGHSYHSAWKYTRAHIYVGAPAGDVTTIIQTGNSTSSPSLPNHALRHSWQYTGEHYGLVVGTGTTAPTTTDDKLESQIAHGEAAGELTYGGCEVYGLQFGALPGGHAGEFTIRRYYTNMSGGVVKVCEAGLYALGCAYAAISSQGPVNDALWRFCIARDLTNPGVPADGIDVLDTEVLEVRYVLKITP